METHHLFQTLLNYLHLHPHAGLWFTFCVAFSESLPLIGTIVPGTITMTIVGVLMGSGAIPLLDALLIASGGAFSGDCIGYFVGYHFNERLRSMWPFKNHPKWLAMGEIFFKKHGGKSIILGRFIGPARSTVPMVAGLLRLTWSRFVIAAIPSAMMWATMYVIPGLLLGALAREVPKAETTRFFIYGISAIIIISLIFWLIQHFFVQLTRAINRVTDNCWRYLMHHRTGKKVIQWIENQQNPIDHQPLKFLLGAIICGILFLILLGNVRHSGIFTGLNKPLFSLLQSIRIPWLDNIFIIFTTMGMPAATLSIALITAAGLALKKQGYAAKHLVAAMILSGGAAGFFKLISYSPRPQGFVVTQSLSSFPSGHSILSFCIFGFIAFLYGQIFPEKYRAIPYTLATIIIACISLSRLYLGAHWFTDVIGSVLVSIFVLFVCIISYRRMPNPKCAVRLSARYAWLLIFISFILPWSFSAYHYFDEEKISATPLHQKHIVSVQAWWKKPLHHTPLYRNNRLGIPFQPFNVQWQGSLTHIEKMLKEHDWQTVDNQTELKATLSRFASFDAEYHMPLLPWLYHNKPPVLVMIKHIPMRQRIIELRLWKSNVHFPPNNEPLWIGATDIRIPPKVLLSIEEHTTISLAGNAGLDDLYVDTIGLQRKYIDSTKDNPMPSKIEALKWNGKILLIRD